MKRSTFVIISVSFWLVIVFFVAFPLIDYYGFPDRMEIDKSQSFLIDGENVKTVYDIDAWHWENDDIVFSEFYYDLTEEQAQEKINYHRKLERKFDSIRLVNNTGKKFDLLIYFRAKN